MSEKPVDPMANLKADIARVAGTSEGLALFRYLMNVCGYQKPSVVANPQTQEVNVNSTIYNEARRNVWLGLRMLIPHDRLTFIELPELDNTKE